MAISDAFGSFLRGALGVFSAAPGGLAADMLRGLQPGAVGEPPPRGTREQLGIYSQTPWVRAIVGRIADAVAAAEWRLYVAARPGERARLDPGLARARGVARARRLKALQDQDELREIASHIFLDTWDTGNAFLTGHATRKTTQVHLETTGEAMLLKERNGAGATVGLWPIPPDWVLSTPTAERRAYRMSYRGWQAEVPETEVLWFTDPNPSNPYGRGTGIVRALGDEIETDEYAAKTTKQFFFNHARPDLIIMPSKENQDQFNEAQARAAEFRMMQKHGGFWNRWKPMFMSRYLEIKELEKDFRAGQFVQIREHERDVCMQTWGIPPEVLGVIENSNRATIQGAEYLFNALVVVPRLEFIRSTIQERLLPEYDARLILDYVSPVQEDQAHMLEVAKAAPWARDVDEWRVAQGLDPLPGKAGKVYLVPTTLRAVAQHAEAVPPVPPAPGGSTDAPKGGGGTSSGGEKPTRGLGALSLDELLELRRLVEKAGDDV